MRCLTDWTIVCAWISHYLVNSPGHLTPDLPTVSTLNLSTAPLQMDDAGQMRIWSSEALLVVWSLHWMDTAEVFSNQWGVGVGNLF